MHKMMDKRPDTEWGLDLWRAEHRHKHPPRPGWGPVGMLTRTQYQPYLDRFHDRRRNEQLDLDEQ